MLGWRKFQYYDFFCEPLNWKVYSAKQQSCLCVFTIIFLYLPFSLIYIYIYAAFIFVVTFMELFLPSIWLVNGESCL